MIDIKIRHGFVTNSSSSSFIISKEFLSDDELNIIKNLDILDTEQALLIKEKLEKQYSYIDSFREWIIEENEFFISGRVCVDNFSYDELFDCLGVGAHVHWQDYPYTLTEMVASINELLKTERERYYEDKKRVCNE